MPFSQLVTCLLLFLFVGIPSFPQTTIFDVSQMTDFPLLQLSEPTEPYSEGAVYLEEVVLSLQETGDSLLLTIAGYLPDSCSQPLRATYSFNGDVLNLDLASWRPIDAMCLQALKPFRLIIKTELPDSPGLPIVWEMGEQSNKIIYESRK